jgi:hypothetical protein
MRGGTRRCPGYKSNRTTPMGVWHTPHLFNGLLRAILVSPIITDEVGSTRVILPGSHISSILEGSSRLGTVSFSIRWSSWSITDCNLLIRDFGSLSWEPQPWLSSPIRVVKGDLPAQVLGVCERYGDFHSIRYLLI